MLFSKPPRMSRYPPYSTLPPTVTNVIRFNCEPMRGMRYVSTSGRVSWPWRNLTYLTWMSGCQTRHHLSCRYWSAAGLRMCSSWLSTTFHHWDCPFPPRKRWRPSQEVRLPRMPLWPRKALQRVRLNLGDVSHHLEGFFYWEVEVPRVSALQSECPCQA